MLTSICIIIFLVLWIMIYRYSPPDVDWGVSLLTVLICSPFVVGFVFGINWLINNAP